ncbi:hypothetical protein OPT61_g1189 [Boeremia exigua]|uniref:Uncharacterized protein n=1 Tax=Boeremia exigua TaxID=749465 RepID=A0ACC2IR05_9PLEO|nr:hypothetical protein OPT61_g1189 [Boeremia exigua]
MTTSDDSNNKEPIQAAAAQTLPPQPQLDEEPYSIFDKRQKALIVLVVSTAATFSGFASNIYFPAIPTIANDLGLAPSLWGPVSDVKGRRVAYCCTFVVFLGACIGLAKTKNYSTLVVLRCLQSTGSASTIAIGSGVIGDITTRAERGSYMGVFQAGLLAPVAIGPVIARQPLLAYQKFTKVAWSPASDEGVPPKKPIDLLGPLRILTTRYATPIIFFLAIYYAVWQMSITAMSSLFESRYGLNETEIGLTFIANGVGSIIGTLTTGKILDVDYRRVKEGFDPQSAASSDSSSSDSFPLEKARLRLIPLFALIQCASIILFGWTIDRHVHIAVPIIATFITGWTAVSTQSIVMTYLVDVFSARNAAASASASLNLARCLLAAGGTSFIMPMVNGIGVGLAFTVCVIVQVVSMLGVFVQRKFAGKWRIAANKKTTKGLER